MPAKSTIKSLPAGVLEQLQTWLSDPSITQQEAADRTNALLEEIGEERRVSKSSVNRYDIKMRRVGERLQQSREVAEMWADRLGTAHNQGKVGQVVNQILRTLALDVSIAAQDGEVDAKNAPAVTKMVKNMAIAMEKLEKATSENVKREAEIRKQAAQEAAEIADTKVRQAGLTAEAADQIKAEILGIAA